MQIPKSPYAMRERKKRQKRDDFPLKRSVSDKVFGKIPRESYPLVLLILVIVGVIMAGLAVEGIKSINEWVTKPEDDKVLDAKQMISEQQIIEARRARTDSIDRELRKSDGTLNVTNYAGAGPRVNEPSIKYNEYFKAGLEGRPMPQPKDNEIHPVARQATSSIDVLPSESHRITITGKSLGETQSKDAYGNATIVLAIRDTYGKEYLCAFSHEESERLLNQMTELLAGAITHGHYKDIKIVVSGIPTGQVYKGFKMLKACRFISWQTTR